MAKLKPESKKEFNQWEKHTNKEHFIWMGHRLIKTKEFTYWNLVSNFLKIAYYISLSTLFTVGFDLVK